MTRGVVVKTVPARLKVSCDTTLWRRMGLLLSANSFCCCVLRSDGRDPSSRESLSGGRLVRFTFMSRFRVLQLNMQFGQVWDDADPDHAPVDLEKTIAEIRSHVPDIIFLQEVEQGQANGVQVNPPPNFTRLKRALCEYTSCFSYPKADPRELPFGIGLAIFARGPLSEIKAVNLPSPSIEFGFQGKRMTPTDRLLLSAKTTMNGRELQLLNTHLLAFFMLGTTSAAHRQQRDTIAAHLEAAEDPAILAGDFNVPEHMELVTQFGEKGFKPVQSREVTWRRRPYVLDHIFYNNPLRCMGYRVAPTMASDHHVLVADFEFS